jgi:Divergent InlB B-repeat domain
MSRILIAVGAGLFASPASAGVRSTQDLPDDTSGPQIHFLYVVPSDSAERQLDTNGLMGQSIARIEHWFEGQTGDQALRVDTYNSVPDITFVRLPHTDAQATGTNPWPLWVIGQDLVAAGFNNPDKVYAAFYDGHSTWACGGATSPALPKLAAMYLQARLTNGSQCGGIPGIGTSTGTPGYLEIALLHDVFHTLGFTPHCAPHQSQDGYNAHVNDSPTDLMYAPDAKSPSGWDWSHAVLDFNHDDYYRAHIPGCPDLSDSPYLEPIPSFPVALTVAGKGSVSASVDGTAAKNCASTCTLSFLRGSTVTLSARPVAGNKFAGWSGSCSGTDVCELTITGGSAVTATFKKSTLHLAIARSGATTRAKAGKPFTAWISARRDDTNQLATGGAIRCTAIVGHQRLRTTTKEHPHSVAPCTWLLPRTATGKRLQVSISITLGRATVTKRFGRRVTQGCPSLSCVPAGP